MANSPLDDDTEEVGVDGVTGDIVELADPGVDSLFTNNKRLRDSYRANVHSFIQTKMKIASFRVTESCDGEIENIPKSHGREYGIGVT